MSECNLTGISPRTETCPVTDSIDVTTHQPKTQNPSKDSSLVPANISPCEPAVETRYLFGASQNTEKTGKRASSAHYFGMKQQSSRLSLSDRLTPSLITAGLIAGTTPTFVRHQCGVPIPDSALFLLDGHAAVDPNVDFTCLSESKPEKANVRRMQGERQS